MNNDINEKIVHAAPVPPFVRFVASAVPMVFDNSLSYYEALCALWKWMQDNLVDVINHNATVTEQYIDYDLHTRELFIELKSYVDNYFDNLDVQEEINNKLDQMAEDGTLQEIITAYIQANVAWTFDTVADMKAATNLVNGSYAQTLGFHSVDDGGKSLYKISDSGTADGGAVIDLANSLFAHLVIKDEVYVEQFGAKGDGVTDDQSAINKAMQSGAGVVRFISGKTYAVKAYEDGQPEGSTTGLTGTTGIIVPSNTVVDLSNATLVVIPNSRQNYNVFTLANVHDVIIENGTIVGDSASHNGSLGQWGYGVSLRIAKNVTLENLNISKCWGDGINLNNAGTVGSNYNADIKIYNCICEDNRRQGMSIENARGVNVYNCKFIKTGNTIQTAPAAGVDIEPLLDSAYDITFELCEFSGNYGAGIIMDGANDNIQNVTVKNCDIHENECYVTNAECFVDYAKNVKIIGNTFTKGNIERQFNTNITLRPNSDITFKDNIVHDYRLAVSCYYNDFCNFYIENNHFTYQYVLDYNDIIEATASTNTNAHGKLHIIGNTFENVSGNNLLNIRSFMGGTADSKIGSIVFKNNYIKGGRWGVRAFCSVIMHENTFINTYDNALYTLSTVAAQALLDIQNNTLIQTNFNTGAAGIFNISSAVPYIIRNNTYYKYALDSTDLISYTPAISRWVQSDQHHATSKEEYNNIIANS